LGHVLERCRAIDGVDLVCCAVPEGPANDTVAAEARRHGAVIFRGSEHDVLDRYFRAAAALGLEVVLRVTSDCPLIDPSLCAAVLKLREQSGADYACNNRPPSWPHGLDCEAVSFSWLERAARKATQAHEREHVTPYIREHPDAHRVNLAMAEPGAAHHRWTLDNDRDLAFLQAMAIRLPTGPAGWDYRAALRIVDNEPDLFLINAGQDRYGGLKKSMAGARP
jgi:spore coat polysaccharide biosynthesis protein SpsF (cytidylyltransferase family)